MIHGFRFMWLMGQGIGLGRKCLKMKLETYCFCPLKENKFLLPFEDWKFGSNSNPKILPFLRYRWERDKNRNINFSCSSEVNQYVFQLDSSVYVLLEGITVIVIGAFKHFFSVYRFQKQRNTQSFISFLFFPSVQHSSCFNSLQNTTISFFNGSHDLCCSLTSCHSGCHPCCRIGLLILTIILFETMLR